MMNARRILNDLLTRTEDSIGAKLNRRLGAALATLAGFAATVNHAGAQCMNWVSGFGPSELGTNGVVHCMAVFDEDGPGGNPPSLFIGGRFDTAGGVTVNNIARWNGTEWSAVGGGVSGGSATVLSLAAGRAGTTGFALYVGGSFTSAGGVVANNIARWDGTSWSALGTGTSGNGGWVRAIRSYTPSGFGPGPMIYAGGDFTNAGGVAVNFIARWNGTAWSALGTTVGTSGGVFAMTEYNGNLVVGGAFPTAGMVTCNFIANWNGTAWSAIGPIASPGVNSTVRALLVDGGALYVGGSFTSAGGMPANRIAKWSGSSWSALGTGTSGAVRALAVFDDECGRAIYAGGDFLTAGGVTTNFIARYVGGTWKGVGGGMLSTVRALQPYFTNSVTALYAGGDFTTAGGIPSNYFAKYQANDLDRDGIYDCWERPIDQGGGIDIDCNGTIDLDLYSRGARFDHKDIFVELDAMTGLGPLPGPVNRVIDAFHAAPVPNPDGVDGITLHVEVDTDRTSNDFTIPLATWTAFSNGWPTGFDALKHTAASGTTIPGYFGTRAERNDANGANILAAKRMVYRYCIFANNCTPPPDATSGMAELDGGNDFMVTLGGWSTPGGTDDQKSGTFMHELGHTLGLYHGGGQVDRDANHNVIRDYRYNYKPNYRSVMNYTWQTPKPWMAAGSWPLALATGGNPAGFGFSTGALPALAEAALLESMGIGGNPAFVVRVGVPAGPPSFAIVPMGGPVNWDLILPFPNPLPVAVDINRIRAGTPASPGDTLLDHNDWLALDYNFRDSPDYADGVHENITDEEMTQQLHDELSATPPSPRCPADISPAPNGNGWVNVDDLFAVISAWGPCPGSCPPSCSADIDYNCWVNIDDLFAVISAWGPCPP
jgi:hypothetical protein